MIKQNQQFAVNPTSSEVISIINAEYASLIISEMAETERADLGHSFVVNGTHPTLGKIVVFNSAEGKSAYVSEVCGRAPKDVLIDTECLAARKFG